ncbi:MAG: hypothetical protein E6G95_01135 [Alphaproteobacteria bacterium]|nr:MAG: hypothetical protein E6G95_01135 [Alphaproteobacteria bacterium]
MDQKCPSCGAGVGREHRFCFQCGRALDSSPLRVREFLPINYTPPHLTERILASRDSMEGERKLITVLFADIKDSTQAIERLDPEEASKRFRPIFDAMLDGVHKYEGVVNRFLGDGVMALFGAPLAHEDHAIRACYSALAINENLAALGERSLEVRVGMNSGEVLVLSIGNDLSIDYDVIGSTVHLARRMEEIARPGSAVLTDATRRLAEGFVNVTPLGAQRVKGISLPVSCFELKDSSKARTRWEIRAAPGLSRFVGRDGEIALLQSWVESAFQGNGQTIEVHGEPGIGKSRLVHELLGQEPIRTSIILDACGSSLTQNTPYWPVSRLLRKWSAINESDDHVTIRAKARRRLLSLNSDFESLIPIVDSLLDLTVEEPKWKALDPPARRAAIQEGLASLIARGAEAEPLTLIFEDVQWFDAETLALLRILSSRLEKSRAVLLLTCRRDFASNGPICKSSKVVDLQPLPSSEARRLLEDVAPPGAFGTVDADAIVRRAGGTPLFIEEIGRSLAANAVNRISSGSDLPPAIRSIMAARLDRLAPDLKHAVQVASVIGRTFPLVLLSHVLGGSVADARNTMDTLQKSHIVLRSSAPPDVEYSFFHLLMQEVAYSSLTQGRRKAAHLAVVDSLEGAYGNRAAEHVELLEYHAAQSEVWPKAFRYACSSGRKALDRCAFEEARGHFEKALQFAERVEAASEIVGDHIEALLSLRNIYNAVGHYSGLHACLDKAQELAVKHRHASLASIKSTRCQLHCVNGNVEVAIEDGKAAVELATAAGNPVGVAAAASILTWAYQLNGSYKEAVQTLEPHLASISSTLRHLRVGTGTISVFALGITAESQAYLGDFRNATRLAAEALEIAGETQHPYDVAMANFALGHVYCIQGEHDSALDALEKGLGVSQEKGIQGLLPWFYALIGSCHYFKQEYEAAREALQRARIASDKMGVYPAQALAEILLGLLQAQVSRDAGEDQVRSALEFSGRNAYHGLRVLALRALVDIRLSHHEYGPESERLCETALKISDDYAMRPEVAHIHFQLARLQHGRGEPDKCRSFLLKAHQLYDQLEMRVRSFDTVTAA